MKYTVSVNEFEYCDGLFETDAQATAHLVYLSKEDNPELAEGLSDKEIAEDCDWGFCVLSISI